MWIELAKNRVLGNLDLGILIVTISDNRGGYQLEHVRITETELITEELHWGEGESILQAFDELADHLDAERLLGEWEEHGTPYAIDQVQHSEIPLGPWLYRDDAELFNLETGARIALGATEDGEHAVTYMHGQQNVAFRLFDDRQKANDYMLLLALLLGVSMAVSNQEDALQPLTATPVSA